MLDVRFLGEREQLLAVATNSALVKVFQREDLSCQLLSGHSAVVLCLDCSTDGRAMVTGSKVSWGQRSTVCVCVCVCSFVEVYIQQSDQHSVQCVFRVIAGQYHKIMAIGR